MKPVTLIATVAMALAVATVASAYIHRQRVQLAAVQAFNAYQEKNS